MNTKKHNILINRQQYHVENDTMTGLEIKQLANANTSYLLVQTVKKEDEFAGGDDIQISDSETVHIKSGLHFRVLNPATFG